MLQILSVPRQTARLMELAPLRAPPSPCSPNTGRGFPAHSFNVQKANDVHLSFYFKSHYRRENGCLVLAALPETAASVVVAAVAVGAAASLLARTTKAPDTSKSLTKICEDCGGSGVCTECNGEGFVLKKMSEESAEKARLAAKNMATRYTAGLPKKWSYCSKCSSSRSCTTCGGTGRISW